MSDICTTLQQSLSKQLNLEGFDVVELQPLPARGDRLVRIKTLEEILEDFE